VPPLKYATRLFSHYLWFTCHSTGCYLPCGCAKSGHFHSCCPSPVLNILLEILWKIVYIAIHECVILVILHIFKMSYQLRNIEQCYLPGKMADNMHSHKKSDHLMSILPPALFPHSYPHNCYSFLSHFYLDSHLWALHQLSVLFLAVSSCFYPQKSGNSAYLVPLYHVSSSPPQLLVLSNSFLSLLTSLNIRSTLCAVSGCLWLSKPF